jgi:hypothetical protein
MVEVWFLRHLQISGESARWRIRGSGRGYWT